MTENAAQIANKTEWLEPPSWPKPDMSIVEGFKVAPPDFPTQIFGNFWEAFILQSAEAKSCPPDYVAAGLLVSASTLIGNSYIASPWEGWTEPPIIWAGCVGHPSSAKTPGLSVGIDLLRELETEMNEDFEARRIDYETRRETAKSCRKKWEEKLAQTQDNTCPAPKMPREAIEPQKPLPKRLIVTDATVESLAPILSNNPKGVLAFRDELSGWFEGMNQYKSGKGADRAFWLEGHNGKAFTVDRVKNGHDGSFTVPNLSISIAGGIQPDKLHRFLQKGDDDGLSARFLFLWPSAVPPKQPAVRPNTGAALSAMRRLRDLMMTSAANGRSAPHLCKLAPEAVEHLNEYRNRLYSEEQEAHGLYLSWLGKNSGRALRIALVIEFMIWAAEGGENPPIQVSEKTFLSVLSLLSDYFAPMAIRSFDSAALPVEMADAVIIAKYIRGKRCRTISSRDIQRVLLRGRKAPTITEALEALVEAGWLRHPFSDTSTGGRPKREYEVNPEFWKEIMR